MPQDVRQWLDEIKRLKQQLAKVRRDHDAAVESANQWRQLYNTEAQQRREEAQRHQETITALRAEVAQLRQTFSAPQNEILTKVTNQREVDQLQSPEQLKAKLMEVMLERDRTREQVRQVTESLEKEKASHLETRNSLTTALGDTVDLLTKAQNKPQSVSPKLISPIEELNLEPSQESEPEMAQLPEVTQLPLPKLPPMEQLNQDGTTSSS